MTRTYYQPGHGRAARVQDLFSAIARRYDLINDLQSLGLHRRWKRQMVALAEPRPRERALDVCCGTGDLVFLLARRGLAVVGVDFSEAMLAVARSRAAKARAQAATAQSQGDVAWVRGDAQHLPLAPASVDIVTVAYGLRNLADWRAGLAEMWRVSRPGGRVVVLDFGKPERAVWRRAYFAYLRWGVPLWGRLICGDAQAYAYILESLRDYPAQRGVAEEMRRLGWAEVRVLDLLGGAMSIHLGRKPL